MMNTTTVILNAKDGQRPTITSDSILDREFNKLTEFGGKLTLKAVDYKTVTHTATGKKEEVAVMGNAFSFDIN